MSNLPFSEFLISFWSCKASFSQAQVRKNDYFQNTFTERIFKLRQPVFHPRPHDDIFVDVVAIDVGQERRRRQRRLCRPEEESSSDE